MPKANVTIAIKCQDAGDYAEKIREFAKDLFDTVVFREGEHVEMTVSDDFSKDRWNAHTQ